GGGGDISQTVTGTLAPGQQVVFAAGPDSSDQGGFNFNNDGTSNGIQIALQGSVSLGADSEVVNLSVYDKDIHAGTPRDVHASPSTENGTPLFSDSYVLEGGDPSGASTGHVFETSQADGHYSFVETADAGNYIVRGTHSYAEDTVGGSPYAITVTISEPSTPGQALTVNSTADVAADPPVQATGGFALATARGATTGWQTVATFTDPGGAEAIGDYSASIAWGDNTTSSTGTISFSGGVFTVKGYHTYTTNGQYTIVTTIYHEASPGVIAVSKATITSVLIGLACGDPTALIIGGTTAADTLKVQKSGNNGDVQDQINKEQYIFHGSSFTSLAIFGQGGGDTIQVANSIVKDACIFTGNGNATVQGGGGNNIIVGGTGADHLTGGNLRNLIIGGGGADT